MCTLFLLSIIKIWMLENFGANCMNPFNVHWKSLMSFYCLESYWKAFGNIVSETCSCWEDDKKSGGKIRQLQNWSKEVRSLRTHHPGRKMFVFDNLSQSRNLRQLILKKSMMLKLYPNNHDCVWIIEHTGFGSRPSRLHLRLSTTTC